MILLIVVAVISFSYCTYLHIIIASSIETLSVPAVLLRRWAVTVVQLCYYDTLSGPSGGSSYLGHYKNY